MNEKDAWKIAREIGDRVGIHDFGLWNFRLIPKLRDAYFAEVAKQPEDTQGWLTAFAYGYVPHSPRD